MKAATLDERRRLVMPAECPPHSAVTIQQLDADTWIVQKHSDSKSYKVVLVPAIDRLPDDPKWEKVENKLAQHAAKKLPVPNFD